MKKQNRKNNKTPYLVVTLACALLVLGLGGNTLAKYVTEKSVDSNIATVAKWGYVINANANDLFVSDYSLNGGTIASKADGDGVSVNGSADTLAPGTTGSMAFSIKGQAEVPSKITFYAIAVQDVYFDPTTGDDYYPIVWSLTKDGSPVEYSFTGNDLDNRTTFSLAEMAVVINAESSEYVAGTVVDDEYVLTWTWALSQGHDDYDTYLGNAASRVVDSDQGEGTAHTTVQFKLNISVEQIQG